MVGLIVHEKRHKVFMQLEVEGVPKRSEKEAFQRSNIFACGLICFFFFLISSNSFFCPSDSALHLSHDSPMVFPHCLNILFAFLSNFSISFMNFLSTSVPAVFVMSSVSKKGEEC